MSCCEAPDPRVLEKNNRLFCGNCKRYLDRSAQQEGPDEPVPETTPPDVVASPSSEEKK